MRKFDRHHRAEPLEARRLLALEPYYYAGELDPSFQSPQQTGDVLDLIRLSDGRYLTARNLDNRVTLMRHLPNGATDSTFGVNGVSQPGFAPRERYATHLALQPDGKILVAYFVTVSEPGQTPEVHQQGVGRLNPDGTKDSSFGTNGSRHVDLGSVPPVGLGLDPAGGILIGSMLHKVARLTSGGELDATYGSGGVASITLPSGGVTRAQTMVVLPDGGAMAGGALDLSQTDSPMTLVRFTPSGQPDPGFGEAGLVVRNIPGVVYDRVEQLALQPDGRVVALLGLATPGASYVKAHVARVQEDGSFDPSFGNGGILNASPDSDSPGSDIAVDQQGRIVVSSESSSGVFVHRFTSSGAFDDTFGDRGRAVPPLGPRVISIGPNSDITGGGGQSLVRYLGTGIGDGPVALEEGVLQITGKRAADASELAVSGNALDVTLNGAAHAFDAGDVQRVNVYLRDADDQVTLDLGDAFDADVVLDLGRGDDAVTVASARFERETTIIGGEGGDRLVVLPDATARLYFDGQSFSNAQYVELHAGDGNDVVTGTINDLSGAGSTIRTNSPRHVRLGGGDDVVDITGGVHSLVEGQDGDDTVNLFGGTCGFEGGDGRDLAVVHGTDAADAFTVNGFNAGRTGSFFAAPVCELVVLRGLGGGDAFTVSTGPSSIGLLDLDGGAGDDAFTVSASQNYVIPRAPLRVLGGAGANTLLVNNSGDQNTPDVLMLNATRVAALPTDSFFPPGITLRYEEIDTLTLNTSRLADAVRVAPSAATAFVINAGLPSAAPGDGLMVDTAGTSDPQHAPGGAGAGLFTFANRRPITYTGFEEVVAVEGPRVHAGAFIVEPRQVVRFDLATPFAASPVPAPEALELLNLSTGQTIDPASIAISSDHAMGTIDFRFPGLTYGALPDGQYRATLRAGAVSDAAGNPLASDFSFELFFLNGDANRDGMVNLHDFNILAANFGQSPRDFSQGDFNYDGTVNLQDFNILAGRFGQAVTATTAATREGLMVAEDVSDRDEDAIDVLLA